MSFPVMGSTRLAVGAFVINSIGCFITIVCWPAVLPTANCYSSFFFFLLPLLAPTLMPHPAKIFPNNPAAKVLSILG